jgi:biotin synthase-like enzyme
VPINNLVQVPGTPLHGRETIDPFDFVRTLAVARILMPRSHVRLSAGREAMSDELQALCFMAGANSIFYGEKLLTTGNPDVEKDQQLFARLGLKSERPVGPQTPDYSANGTMTPNYGHTGAKSALMSASTDAGLSRVSGHETRPAGA